MERDPFAGDIARLESERTAFRRSLGDWRLFFDVERPEGPVHVRDVARRITTTYRKRR